MEDFDFSSLVSKEEIEKATEKPTGDSNYWKPPNGKSVVRLLPRLESKSPFKTVWTHRNGEDKAIATCLRTWNEKNCPVCAKSWALWESDIKTEKDLGYSVKRGDRYIFNVFVVKDESNPESVGQVKLLSVGKKLFQMIKDAGVSDDLGMSIYVPQNGFDLEINRNPQGADGYPDYTSSRFLVKPYTLKTDMSKLKDDLFDLNKIIHKDSADDLKTKFKFLFDSGELNLATVAKTAPVVTKTAEKTTPVDVPSDESFDESEMDEELAALLPDKPAT